MRLHLDMANDKKEIHSPVDNSYIGYTDGNNLLTNSFVVVGNPTSFVPRFAAVVPCYHNLDHIEVDIVAWHKDVVAALHTFEVVVHVDILVGNLVVE